MWQSGGGVVNVWPGCLSREASKDSIRGLLYQHYKAKQWDFDNQKFPRLLVLQNTPNSSWFGRNHPGAWNSRCLIRIAGWVNSQLPWSWGPETLQLTSPAEATLYELLVSPIRCIGTAALLKGTRKGGTLSLAELAKVRCADGRGIPFLPSVSSVSHLSGMPVV